jgi:methionyl aminopeptidase
VNALPNDKPEDSGDEEETPAPLENGSSAAKKKKKKPKKKKTSGGAGGAAKQTSPPTVAVSKLYPDGTYPLGEIREYTNEYVFLPWQVRVLTTLQKSMESNVGREESAR